MIAPSPPPPHAPDPDHLSLAVERAALAIGRLDALVSGSSVQSAWRMRAAWTGYARALRLHGAEIDEVDVFSWGTGIKLPGRKARTTLIDEFATFEPWLARLSAGNHWTDLLPPHVARPAPRSTQPRLLRALNVVADYARTERSVAAWLFLPIALSGLGLTQSPLPCLIAGDRRLLFSQTISPGTWRRMLAELEERAEVGRSALAAIENIRAQAVALIARERKTSSLGQLAALILAAPVQTPQSVATNLGLTLSGAGKLLARASDSGLLVEISGRKAWRVYVMPDLAVELGLSPRPRGRPRSPFASPEPIGELADALASFDREMAAFNARFGLPEAMDPEDD